MTNSSSLGAFCISLSVKDLSASQAFYEKLGFVVSGGEPTQNWLVLRNGPHVIGLFQGMFEDNILTFNPGWNQSAEALEEFTDIREIQRRLKSEGLDIDVEVDSADGPGHCILRDPDGNTIMLDQHV